MVFASAVLVISAGYMFGTRHAIYKVRLAKATKTKRGKQNDYLQSVTSSEKRVTV